MCVCLFLAVSKHREAAFGGSDVRLKGLEERRKFQPIAKKKQGKKKEGKKKLTSNVCIFKDVRVVTEEETVRCFCRAMI